LLNVPDLAVLAALKWVSVGDWVCSRGALDGNFALFSVRIENGFERTAHGRAGSSDMPCSRRTMIRLFTHLEIGVPLRSFWTANERIK